MAKESDIEEQIQNLYKREIGESYDLTIYKLYYDSTARTYSDIKQNYDEIRKFLNLEL